MTWCWMAFFLISLNCFVDKLADYFCTEWRAGIGPVSTDEFKQLKTSIVSLCLMLNQIFSLGFKSGLSSGRNYQWKPLYFRLGRFYFAWECTAAQSGESVAHKLPEKISVCREALKPTSLLSFVRSLSLQGCEQDLMEDHRVGVCVNTGQQWVKSESF